MRLPAPQFLPAYEKALGDVSREVYAELLHAATETAYFYGEEALAAQYFSKLKMLFPQLAREAQILPYIERLLREQVEAAVDLEDGFLQLIVRVFDDGYAHDRPDIAARFRDRVEALHRSYPPGAIPPFPELYLTAFKFYLVHQRASPYGKSRVWKQVPDRMKREVLAEVRFVEFFRQQIGRTGLAFDEFFPAPPPSSVPLRKP